MSTVSFMMAQQGNAKVNFWSALCEATMETVLALSATALIANLATLAIR